MMCHINNNLWSNLLAFFCVSMISAENKMYAKYAQSNYLCSLFAIDNI